MFNFNHLYYFYMTAKLGGVMKASIALRIAQPSLSAQIKTLEGELNLRLFHKVGRNMALTPDGERAYGYCRKIFEAAEEFSDYLHHSDSGKTHRSRIGVTHEIERPFIADILSTILRKKNAREQPLLSMISGDHSALLENLKAGDLDVVITNRPSYGSDTQIVADLSMPVLAVATPELVKRLATKRNVPLHRALKEKDVGFVLPSDRLKIRIESDLFLQKYKLRNRVVFESDILAVVVRAAVDGAGVAFLPYPYIARELNHDTLMTIGDGSPLWRHNLFILSRVTKQADPVVIEIKDHFIKLSTAIAKV